jgi:hypothetical protein
MSRRIRGGEPEPGDEEAIERPVLGGICRSPGGGSWLIDIFSEIL